MHDIEQTRLTQTKVQARIEAASVRAALHGFVAPAPAIEALVNLALARDARVISAYLPIGSEFDPLPAMRLLAGSGRALCVPVIIAKRQPLRFRYWHEGARMVPSPLGTFAPATGRWLVPDFIIVPLLAYDDTGHRLGYGGGFYDRTLAGLRAGGRCFAAGLAYAGQRVDTVPTGAHDAPLDAVVTETGVTHFT